MNSDYTAASEPDQAHPAAVESPPKPPVKSAAKRCERQRTAGGRGRRLWLFRNIAIFGSMLVGLVIAETAVRVWRPIAPLVPVADTAIVLFHTDPNGPISLTPNWEGYVGYVWTTINSQGFRDRLYSPEPPLGTLRIAVLGDSYTMGDAVTQEATYPKQLEPLLTKRFAVEVMNCGVSATNTRNQVHTLKRVLADFHPHYVVLGYDINDLQSYKQTRFERYEAAGYSFIVGEDGRARVSKEETWLQSLRSIIYRRSELCRWAASVKSGPAGRELDAQSTVRGWIEDGGAALSFKALEEMRDLCRTANVGFFVHIIPGQLDMPRSVENMDDYPYKNEHTLMHEAMRSRGIDFVDLLPHFAGQETRRLEAHPFDRHYSVYGNQIIAKALAEHLPSRLERIWNDVIQAGR